jgi:hypothetical protein
VTRRGSAWMAGLVLAALNASTAGAGDARAPAVVELFTSQGCSSCPAADEVLGELAGRSDIVALSLPVDYWDYLGWRDTLAEHAFTERQKAYAAARGDGQVYTPQVVVNGMVHAVGSRLTEIEAAVETSRQTLKAPVASLALKLEGEAIVIEVGAGQGGSTVSDGRILVAVTQRRVPVEITRGENRGKTIIYHNVVRKLAEVGRWTGAAQSVRLDKAELMPAGTDGCVAILQEGSAGPILAAAQLAGP